MTKTYTAAEAWATASRALDEVSDVLRNPSRTAKITEARSRITWYQIIYGAATQDLKAAELLHDKLKRWIKDDLEKHNTAHARQLAESGSSAEELFSFIAKCYASFKQLQKFASFVFGYLDQHYAKKAGIDSIKVLFNKAFHASVYRSVRVQLVTAIIRNINKGRNGDSLDRDAIRSAVGIFNDVGTSTCINEEAVRATYVEDFESHYLNGIHAYYSVKAAHRIADGGGHYVYLQWAEFCWKFEDTLAQDIMRESSLPAVYDILQRVLLQSRAQECIKHPDSGFKVLLQDRKDDDLRRMYYLFKRVPADEAVKLMASELEAYVVERGAAVFATFTGAPTTDSGSAVDKQLVDSCMDLYATIGALLLSLFDNNALLQEGRKRAFEQFVNVPLSRTEQQGDKTIERKTNMSEILASYLDAVMKNEFKDITDEEEELSRLDKLASLFAHLKEKDIFQEYYKAKLAKRLLQTTPNERLEVAFLEKLQRLMGKSFTHKMEGMLRDRETTLNVSNEFNADALSQRLGKTGFAVQILTAGHWPAYKTDALEAVDSLRECITAFTLFYKKKFATRQLNWIHMLGTATLSVAFPKGVKEVASSTYQASILVSVDAQPGVTVAALGEQLKLDVAKVLKPQIASMYLSKQFPLLCLVNEAGEPQETGRGIGDGDRLAINREFTHKMRKFKLPLPTAAAKEGMPTDPELEARRKLQVDACIVRVMKSRRTLHYTELLDLVIQQLSKLFTPQPKLIKTRVEDLITRGYLKRDADDSAKFEYLA